MIFPKSFLSSYVNLFPKENIMRVLANGMKQQRSQGFPKVSFRGLPFVFTLISSKLILAKETFAGIMGEYEN